MYPIERSLHSLKQYVRNKACAKWSIEKGYLMNESSTFCSRYLSGIETRFTRDDRNDDSINENEVLGVQSICSEGTTIESVTFTKYIIRRKMTLSLVHPEQCG